MLDIPKHVVLRAQTTDGRGDMLWTCFRFETLFGREISIYVPGAQPTGTEIDQISAFLHIWAEE